MAVVCLLCLPVLFHCIITFLKFCLLSIILPVVTNKLVHIPTSSVGLPRSPSHAGLRQTSHTGPTPGTTANTPRTSDSMLWHDNHRYNSYMQSHIITAPKIRQTKGLAFHDDQQNISENGERRTQNEKREYKCTDGIGDLVLRLTHTKHTNFCVTTTL